MLLLLPSVGNGYHSRPGNENTENGRVEKMWTLEAVEINNSNISQEFMPEGQVFGFEGWVENYSLVDSKAQNLNGEIKTHQDNLLPVLFSIC